MIHWVSAEHVLEAPVRLFDRLFSVEKPEADKECEFVDFVNPESLSETVGLCEPSLAEIKPGETCQFERIGYFCADSELSEEGAPVFNRTVGLRDSWAKKNQ